MTEREEVDGVEHIRLPYTVLAYQTIDLWRQFQRGGRDVLIVKKRQLFENHDAKIRIFSYNLFVFHFFIVTLHPIFEN
jgi:hypothetical protein